MLSWQHLQQEHLALTEQQQFRVCSFSAIPDQASNLRHGRIAEGLHGCLHPYIVDTFHQHIPVCHPTAPLRQALTFSLFSLTVAVRSPPSFSASCSALILSASSISRSNIGFTIENHIFKYFKFCLRYITVNHFSCWVYFRVHTFLNGMIEEYGMHSLPYMDCCLWTRKERLQPTTDMSATVKMSSDPSGGTWNQESHSCYVPPYRGDSKNIRVEYDIKRIETHFVNQYIISTPGNLNTPLIRCWPALLHPKHITTTAAP